MGRQKQKSQAESIAGVLKRVVGKIEEQGPQVSVLDAWKRVVAGDIQEHARPVLLRGESLIVGVDSSPWLYEIATKHKGRILAGLRKELGDNAPREIKLKIGYE